MIKGKQGKIGKRGFSLLLNPLLPRLLEQQYMYSTTILIRHLCDTFHCVIQGLFSIPFDNFSMCFKLSNPTPCLRLPSHCMSEQPGFTVHWSLLYILIKLTPSSSLFCLSVFNFSLFIGFCRAGIFGLVIKTEEKNKAANYHASLQNSALTEFNYEI